MIDRLLAFHSRLLLAIHGIPDDDLRRPEKEGAWSIADVVLHLSQLELLTAVRLRLMVAEEEPELPRLSQEAWVARLRGTQSVAESLEQFWSVRRQNVSLLRALSPSDMERTGVHRSLGRLTVERLVQLVDDHAEQHLRQIERIKTTLGLEVSTSSNLAGVEAGALSEARSPGPGVRVHDLWSDGTRRALQVEFDAGAQWPGLDYHVPGPEEVFVLSGDFDDGNARYEAGTFLHHPAGTSHSPVSQNGCVLLVFYPEG